MYAVFLSGNVTSSGASEESLFYGHRDVISSGAEYRAYYEMKRFLLLCKFSPHDFPVGWRSANKKELEILGGWIV